MYCGGGTESFSDLESFVSGHTTDTQQLWDTIADEHAKQLADEEEMDVIRREFDATLFEIEHHISDHDYDDLARNDLSDPDDDLEIEAALEGCPFDVDELLDLGNLEVA